ncbi:MAG TPA: hypothetical protein VIV14_13175 [Gammaproteobacteria bacterium]
MGGRRGPGAEALREQLAQEAARLIVDHGMHDYGQAKRKAAQRFGTRDSAALPSNTEIEERVIERQRIYDPQLHERRLAAMRSLAASLMEALSEFQPRLVGPVLSGSVTENSPLELHVFTDAPEAVLFELERQGIDARDCQRRYRLNTQELAILPGFRFTREHERIYVIVFPEKGVRQAPLSPVDRKPMQRASRRRVLALLAGDSGF